MVDKFVMAMLTGFGFLGPRRYQTGSRELETRQ
jgi:hypothetical protein